MPSFDIPLIAAEDDACVFEDWTRVVQGTGGRIGWYQESGVGTRCHMFFRFQGVAIPAGAVITEAYVHFGYQDGTNEGVLEMIYGADASSPAAPLTWADWLAVSKTTSSVPWAPPSGYSACNSPSLVPILQELAASYPAAFAAGTSVMFMFMDNGTPQYLSQRLQQYEWGLPAYTTTLHITYEIAGAPLVTSVAPSAIAQGQSNVPVTITGQNLGALTDVVIWNALGTAEDTTITHTESATPTVLTLSVTTSGLTALGTHKVTLYNAIGQVDTAIFISAVTATARDPGIINSTPNYGEAWRYLTQSVHRDHFIKAMVDFGLTDYMAQVDATVFAKFTDEPASMAASIQAFNAAGIKVWASWNGIAGFDTVVGGHTMRQFAEAVLEWNISHPAAKFFGMEFDLEPADGSTNAQHATHCANCATTLGTLRSYVSTSGGTVANQALPLALFAQPRWGVAEIIESFSLLVDQVDLVEMDHYQTDTTGTIQTSCNSAIAALARTTQRGRYFMVYISVTENGASFEGGTRYGLGRTAYEQAMAAYDAYYASNSFYRGLGHYFADNAWNHFEIIERDSIVAPSGVVAAGNTVTFSYAEQHMLRGNPLRTFGVMMEVRDSTGVITYLSRLIDSSGTVKTPRTISLVLPSGLANGAAYSRLTLWSVSYPNGNNDWLLYTDYLGYESQLLSLSMEGLMAATAAPATGTTPHRRATPLLLQDSGWIPGLNISAGGTETAPSVTTGSVLDATTTSLTVGGSLGSLGTSPSVQVWAVLGGVASARQTLTAPGSVEFQFTGLAPNVAYNYQIQALGSNGLTATGVTLQATTDTDGGGAEGNIRVIQIQVPNQIVVGQNTIINATVYNYGTSVESAVIEMTGGFSGSATVTNLGPGAQTQIGFLVIPMVTGTYSINIGGMQQSLTVAASAAGSAIKPQYIAAALGLIAVIAIVSSRKKT